MRRSCLVIISAVLFSAAAWAELQNVTVGGEIRIRGRYYMNTFNEQLNGAAGLRREIRIPGGLLPKRPIGAANVASLFSWDDKIPDWHFYETSVVLNTKADFTDDVSAFIELYNFGVWGEGSFRSDYVTGADNRGNGSDNVQLNQAYINVKDMWGSPLDVRIGRQALKFGKGWLVTDMLTPTQRLSFDGIRLTYDVKPITVDVFATKLVENGIAEQDGDVDFYGIYGNVKTCDALDVSAYWFWLRDATARRDTQLVWFGEWLENLLGLDDYDVTNLHTVGLRGYGKAGGFDYDLEVAYQFGSADAHGIRFKPLGSPYGDTKAEYDNWAAELNAGYTFDVAMKPRVLVMASYFQGQDNRDISFIDWLNPFYRAKSSVSFNRLFSDSNHMPVVNDNGWLSNFIQAGAGVEFKPTDSVLVHMHVAKDWADKPFDLPWSIKLGRYRVPIMPSWSFLTQEGSTDIGWEGAIWVKYNYTKDLSFLLYYNHLWVGEGLADGAYIQFNGTDFSGGTRKSDADYVFWMTTLKF
ncbi:MAG TPA: alginate export family protein [Candidatus Hydrogenedentes bacterium]|nr:alginate export family protein [Candidatus Hydrogenedentota bacterium]HOS03032.1 alginate export family protein [Candidatus Hydrogenedentota bacterium]